MSLFQIGIYSIIGIYFTMTLYHFLVWLGRKKDLSGLAISLLAFSFLVFSVITEISQNLNSELLQDIADYLFTVSITCFLPFFGYSIGIIPERIKKLTMIGSASIIGIGIISIFLRLSAGSNIVTDLVLFGALLLYVIPANIINVRYFFVSNMHRDKERARFFLGFLVLMICLIICVSFVGLSRVPIHDLRAILMFHLPFIFMMLIFTHALTVKFNREHADLNDLKNTLESKVEDRTRQLRRANAQKTQFIVNFAHETKTPLTLITSHLDEYLKSHGAHADIRAVRRQFEKLKRDMLNILDYEKLARGQVFYDHGRIVDASRLVEAHVELFRQLARPKRIAIGSSVAGGVFLKIDPLALESVVNNLLDNAIKYTGEDGRVEVSLAEDRETVRLAVSDTGPGIPPAERRAIFEPFYQLSHQKRSTQGIGMGLNIVKKIMDEVKGTVELSSRPGFGTTFVLAFGAVPPGQRESAGEEGAELVPAPFPEAWPEAELLEEHVDGRPNILVVDDNRDLLAGLQRSLRADYNVYYALSGRKALEKLETMPKPDAIISDIMMDNLDGYAFRDALVERGGYSSVPFIFLTALASTSEKVTGIRKGAVDFISKPFHADELRAKLGSLIKMRQALTRENLALVRSRLQSQMDAVGRLSNSPNAGRRARAGRKKELFDRYGISKQQIAIIALLKCGLLRKEICAKLNISINTLNTQLRRVFDKCRVNNKTELLNIFEKYAAP